MTSSFFLGNYFFNPYALPHFIGASVIAFLGIFVYLQNRRSTVNFSYLLVCASGAWWLAQDGMVMSCGDWPTALFWAKAVYVGISLIPPSMLFFSVAWLGQMKARGKWVAPGYALGCFFIILFLSTDLFVVGAERHYFGFFSRLGPLSVLYLFYFFGMSGVFFWNLYQGYRKETAPMKKAQIGRVLFAFVVAFFGATEFLPTYGIGFYPLGFLTVFLFCAVIANSIIRYKLMEIETVIHKTIGWFFASASLALPLIALLYLSRGWYTELPAIGQCLYLGSLILAFLFVVKGLQPRVDQFFQRQRYDLEAVLNNFSEEVVHLRGLGDLIQKIADTVTNTIYVNPVAILLYQDRSQSFVPLGTSGDSPLIDLGLEPASPLARWLAKNDMMIQREFLDIDPRYETIRKEAHDYFQKSGAAICVPFVLNEVLIGLANLGRKANLKPFTAFDYEFLSHLRSQATIALSNSLVYDRVEELVKKRTEELVQTQQQLVQAEKMATVGLLAGGVAHEINNPLTAILTNAQLLMSWAKDEEGRESLELIEEGAKRCRSIVEKLMVYSRKPPARGEVTDVNLEKVLDNVAAFLGYQLAQENIQLVKSLESNGPFLVTGSETELEQVFTNLVVNSKDAIQTVRKSGRIEISLGQQENKIKVQIQDNGCGIPQENVAKIFDPFFTTKDVGKGTGLGLSVTYRILQDHGATIECESKEGEGTKFTILFRAAKTVSGPSPS